MKGWSNHESFDPRDSSYTPSGGPRGCRNRHGQDGHRHAARLGHVLNAIADAPDKGIPQELFAKAECILVFPSVTKAAFIVGGKGGHGVASCRQPDGRMGRFTIGASTPVASGNATIRFEFAYDGGGLGKGGVGTIYVNGLKVAEGRIAITQAMMFSAHEGADVGEDGECHGRMMIIAALHAGKAIRAILECLGLLSRAPPIAAAAAEPEEHGIGDGFEFDPIDASPGCPHREVPRESRERCARGAIQDVDCGAAGEFATEVNGLRRAGTS